MALLTRIEHFFRHFQIELFLFVFIFSLAVEDVTVTLIAQDKICMRKFNSTSICANLSKIGSDGFNGSSSSTEDDSFLVRQKDQILMQVTTFNFYQSLIYTVPVIFSSMFLSSWADRHKSSTKTLVCLTAFMAGLESVFLFVCAVYFDSNVDLMLIGFIFFPLVGGAQSLGMAGISYLSSTTDPAERVKRFSILELVYIVSHPLGIFIGGLIIQNPKLTYWARTNGQLHNYHQVLALAVLGKFGAFIYAVMMKFKPRCGPVPTVVGGAVVRVMDTDETVPLLYEGKGQTVQTQGSKNRTKFQKFVTNSTDLFVWRNIFDSVEVVVRRRPNRAHIFIWLLLIIMTIVTMTGRANLVIMFQFVQKLYSWDAGTFSRYNSTLFITTHLFGLLIVTPILTRFLKISDSTLMILGLISLMSQNFIRGTIIHVTAFCVSYFFGSITSIIQVAARTKLSKLAPPGEQNRIFGVLTMLETISPLLGISLYTAIFNQTISYYPGTVFQLSCALLLIPLALALYIRCQPVISAAVLSSGSIPQDLLLPEDSKLLVKFPDTNNNIEGSSGSSGSSTRSNRSYSESSSSSVESKKTVISICP